MNLKLNKKIKLGSKVIDHNSKPYLIGEVSCNHNGEIANAKKLILTAKKFGADAVKFQTYTPDTITLKSDKKDFKIKSGLGKGKTLWDLYNQAQTPFEWFPKLFKFAKEKKIDCFSSPFDETAVDLLEKLKCPFYKLASFELNHIPLIKKIAKKGWERGHKNYNEKIITNYFLDTVFNKKAEGDYNWPMHQYFQ